MGIFFPIALPPFSAAFAITLFVSFISTPMPTEKSVSFSIIPYTAKRFNLKRRGNWWYKRGLSHWIDILYKNVKKGANNRRERSLALLRPFNEGIRKSLTSEIVSVSMSAEKLRCKYDVAFRGQILNRFNEQAYFVRKYIDTILVSRSWLSFLSTMVLFHTDDINTGIWINNLKNSILKLIHNLER